MEKEKFSNIDSVFKTFFFLSETKSVRVFVPIKHCQPFLIFVGKTRTLHKRGWLNGTPTQAGSGLTCKYYTRLDRPSRDKLYSLFGAMDQEKV
jgi:hypothetical protein